MSERKQRIALDMDDTLADTLSVVISRINRERGMSLTKADFKDWHMASLQKEHGLSWEYTYGIYHKVWVEEWESIPALASNGLLAEASKRFSIDIVTSRSEGSIRYCKEWLGRHYRDIEFGGIVRAESVHEKALLDYDVYIDDGPTLADALIEANLPGRRMLIMDQVYNRHVKEDSHMITRVRDVNEALGLMLRKGDWTETGRTRNKSTG